MSMTRQQYLDNRQAMHGKAIRVAVYDAAILIGGILLIDKVTALDIWEAESIFSGGDIDWRLHFGVIFTFAFFFMWLGFIIQRYRDWKDLTWLEERVLDYDPDEGDDLGRPGLVERLRRLE